MLSQLRTLSRSIYWIFKINDYKAQFPWLPGRRQYMIQWSKIPITCDIKITLLVKVIKIINSDQKDGFPLWEVHIKKNLILFFAHRVWAIQQPFRPGLFLSKKMQCNPTMNGGKNWLSSTQPLSPKVKISQYVSVLLILDYAYN